MGKKVATNTFNKGLNTDTHPLSTPNDVLTDALNATIITLNGDEQTLQNDFGNVLLDSNIQGTILGMAEYGGIIYIASVKDGVGELGSFPSPDYDNVHNGITNLQNQYRPLNNLDNGEFKTEKFNFSVNNPVNIEIQESYDGSVNLILNDGLNIPRLINSGFSVRSNQKCELVDREGDYDTNKYSNSTFDIETSLNKRINKIPKVEYNGVIEGGEMKVGNYVFYFKYCDIDGNESDIIEESGIVSCFKGTDGDPKTIDGGFRDENSNKSIYFTLSNLDGGYNYIIVYYSRESSDINQNRATIYRKIDHKYLIEGNTCKIIITGAYNEEDKTSEDINIPHVILDYSKTQAQINNMLFQANVKQSNAVEYNNNKEITLKELSQLISLGYTIEEAKNTIGYINPNTYTDTTLVEGDHHYNNEYYSTKNIYYNVGYWAGELYRFGIVYIFDDGSLSPVFNIKGKVNRIPNDKGVIMIPLEVTGVERPLYFIKPEFDENFFSSLVHYPNIKGYFFVRQKRMPLRLCQAYLLPNDNESQFPILFRKRNNNLLDFTSQNMDNLEVYKGRNWKDYKFNLVGESFIFDAQNTNWFAFKIHQGNQDWKLHGSFTNITQGYHYVYYKEEQEHTESNHFYVTAFKYTNGLDGKTYNVVNVERTQFNNTTEENQANETNTPELLYGVNPDGTVIMDTYAFVDLAGCAIYKWENYQDDKNAFISIGEYFENSLQAITFIINKYLKLLFGDSVPEITSSNIINNTTSDDKRDTVDYEGRLFYFPPSLANGSSFNNVFTKIDSSLGKTYQEMIEQNQENMKEQYLDFIEQTGRYTGLCPDFYLKQPYFNQFFTGKSFYYETSQCSPSAESDIDESTDNKNCLIQTDQARYYIASKLKCNQEKVKGKADIVSLTDSCQVGSANGVIFKATAGNAQMAYKTSYYYVTPQKTPKPKDFFLTGDTEQTPNALTKDDEFYNTPPFVRGIFSPYLGIKINPNIDDNVYMNGQLIDIFIPGYQESQLDNYITIREEDSSPYYTVSERFSIDADTNTIRIARGDCYLCTYTQRINRNFNDPETPTNDEIVENNTWEKHFKDGDTDGKTHFSLINRADVNAVRLGSWVTFKFQSSYNLSIRSNDSSWVSEKTLFGRERSYYPKNATGVSGSNKLPESQVMNDGFNATVGQKVYHTLPDAPYYNSVFNNRVYYSDITGTTQFQNGYRVIQATHYRDYNPEFGSITKILNSNGNLFVVFEHGVGICNINERQLITDTADDGVYIHSGKVLPDELTILSETYGSKWADSIVQTPYYIYGFDTVEKKIWRTNGREPITVISDLNVERFLLENIKLQENDTFISLDSNYQNIKGHHNQSKSDIIFTYWDLNKNKWSLCYNEGLKRFITFYSWIPTHSVNIDDNFITSNIENKLWVHGRHNKFGKDNPLPTNWFGEQHPFEFEFVVLNSATHKIFDDLILISNSAEPESFHFQITGDVYSFKDDKPNMYYRQEETKKFYRDVCGSQINYDKDFESIHPEQKKKSTYCPLYYQRNDTINDIYDKYAHMTLDSTDQYHYLSGTELVHDKRDNEFNLVTRVQYVPLSEGRIRGNSQYKEDKWNIQIPSLVFRQCNEQPWQTPPIILDSVPNDVKVSEVELTDNISQEKWTSRKETKIRDKYCKIRVRYSGKKLVIISAIYTLYTESFS